VKGSHARILASQTLLLRIVLSVGLEQRLPFVRRWCGGGERRRFGFRIHTPPPTLVHWSLPVMFRISRPLLQAFKKTTGIHGLHVHPDPLPELITTYESTLSVLSAVPQTSVYRQSAEALTRHKLNIVKGINGDIAQAENRLNEGQIEESLEIAADELSLVAKMVEWKA